MSIKDLENLCRLVNMENVGPQVHVSSYQSLIAQFHDDTKDVHILCTDLQEDVSTIFKYARKRVTIETSYKDAKQLGFGEYRFRKSEAALIHAHLVFLAYILLQILRFRLLSYIYV